MSLGADVTANDNYAVRWASHNGHLDTVQYLVSQGADIAAYKTMQCAGLDATMLLILWTYNGHLDIVQYLVSQGAPNPDL